MALMGLDVGTSGCKAAIFSDRGEILAITSDEYPATSCASEFHEISPETVWNTVAKCIRKCTDLAKSEQVDGLSISSFGEAAVPLDQNGNVLRNAILLTDPRGQEQLTELVEKLGVEFLSTRTGLPLHPMYSLNRLLWIKEHEPDIYNSIDQYLQFEDYIIFKLTGQAIVDYSLASRTMAFNVLDKSWDSQILDAAGIPVNMFARAVPSGTAVGFLRPTLVSELGLSSKTLVVTGGHDQPCTALGSGIIYEGMAVDGIGTSECITTIFDQPILSRKLFEMNYHCGPHVLEDKFITFAYTMSAGAVLQWYRDTIGRPEYEKSKKTQQSVYQLLDQSIDQKPSQLLVSPHFDGSGTPHLNPESKGAILGLSRKTSTSEIYRAMLESITYEMKYNLECLADNHINITSLRAAGGGAKSKIWLQIKADILNRPIATLENTEAGTLGAAILAGIAVGKYRNAADACKQLVREKEQFEPDTKQNELYELNYQRYKRMYSALVKIWE